MKDKIQKIREEVKMVVNRRLNLLNDNYFDLNKEAEGFTNEIMDIIDSMQGEPQVKDSAEIQHVNETCKENGNSLTQEPVSEDLEQAIDTYLSTYFGSEQEKQEWPFLKKMAMYFAKWQKKQMMAKAVEVTIAMPYPRLNGYFTQLVDSKEALPFGENIKVLVIKQE